MPSGGSDKQMRRSTPPPAAPHHSDHRTNGTDRKAHCRLPSLYPDPGPVWPAPSWPDNTPSSNDPKPMANHLSCGFRHTQEPFNRTPPQTIAHRAVHVSSLPVVQLTTVWCTSSAQPLRRPLASRDPPGPLRLPPCVVYWQRLGLAIDT